MAKPGSTNKKAKVVKKLDGAPPDRKPGRNGVVVGSGVPFSKTNQPSSEAKKEGWRKRNALKDLLSISPTGFFDGSTKDYRTICAKYFGIDKKEVTNRMIMDFRQIEKAILKADTQAYIAVNDRAFGKPKGEEPPAKRMHITINGTKVEQKEG